MIISHSNNHTLEFDDQKHVYKLDAETIPGVTSINKNGYPESAGIKRWKTLQACDYVANSLLKLKKKPTKKRVKEIINHSLTAYKRIADEAANIGSIIHQYVETVMLNKPFDMTIIQDHRDSTILRRCIESFLQWKSTIPEESVMAIEQIVASPLYKFGGRIDLLRKAGKKLRLIDYKTSKDFYVEYFIQSGGYSLAILEWLGLEIDEIELVRFGKYDGKFETKLITNKSEIIDYQDQFIRNLETLKFQNKYQ